MCRYTVFYVQYTSYKLRVQLVTITYIYTLRLACFVASCLHCMHGIPVVSYSLETSCIAVLYCIHVLYIAIVFQLLATCHG